MTIKPIYMKKIGPRPFIHWFSHCHEIKASPTSTLTP